MCADGTFRRCNQNQVNLFVKLLEFFTNSWRKSKQPWRATLKRMRRIRDINLMNPEMQTALLNTYPPKIIATMLKALREQLKENYPLSAVEEIAGPAPEILEYDQFLRGGGGFWDDVSGGYLPEDLTSRREEIEWVLSEGVHEIVPMQDVKMQARSCWS